jgi:hypothetical protein
MSFQLLPGFSPKFHFADYLAGTNYRAAQTDSSTSTCIDSATTSIRGN